MSGVAAPPAAVGAVAGTAAAGPLNEAHIQSAVAFLSNPKVATSPISRRVAFLEQKGLKGAEIAEALRRVSPGSPEHTAVAEGVAAGKSAAESVKGLDPPATAAAAPAVPATAAVPASVPALPTGAAAPATSAYGYPVPPGFVAGPPAYAGGPPVFYQLPSAAAAAPVSAGTSWTRVALATAGVLGAVATAGYVAKRALGLEITATRSLGGDAAEAAAASAAASSQGLLPASSASSSQQGQPQHALGQGQASPLPPAVPSSASAFASGEHRLAAPIREESSSDSDDDEDGQSEEKYLGAWLGTADEPAVGGGKRKGKKRSKRGSNAALAAQLSAVGDKLDLVCEALRDNQNEWRRVASSSTPSARGASDGVGASGSGNAKMEALLTSSIQTQNEMLATLKIMLSAQARAAAAANAANATIGAPAAPAQGSAAAAGGYGSAPPTSAFEQPAQAAPAAQQPQKSWIEQNMGAIQESGLGLNQSLVGGATTSAFSSSAESPSHWSAPGVGAGVGGADPVGEGVRNLEEALVFLRANNSLEEVRSATNAMVLYTDNLLTNLAQPRYRKILLANSAYESRVRKTKGAERVLLAAGFEIRTPYIEWVMPDSSGENPAVASGSAADGTGTGLVMDEAQKTRLLQEAVAMLKQFQAKLQSEQMYDGASAGRPFASTTASYAPSPAYSPALPSPVNQQQQQFQQQPMQPSQQIMQQPQQMQTQQPLQQQPQQPQQQPSSSSSSSSSSFFSNPSSSYQPQQMQPQPQPQMAAPLMHPQPQQQVSTNLTNGTIFAPPQMQQPQQPAPQSQEYLPPQQQQQQQYWQNNNSYPQQQQSQPMQPQQPMQQPMPPQQLQQPYHTPAPQQRQEFSSPQTSWQPSQPAEQQQSQMQQQAQMQAPLSQLQAPSAYQPPHSQPATPWQPPAASAFNNGAYATQSYPNTPLQPPQFQSNVYGQQQQSQQQPQLAQPQPNQPQQQHQPMQAQFASPVQAPQPLQQQQQSESAFASPAPASIAAPAFQQQANGSAAETPASPRHTNGSGNSGIVVDASPQLHFADASSNGAHAHTKGNGSDGVQSEGGVIKADSTPADAAPQPQAQPVA